MRLGMEIERIEPGHPQQNGRHASEPVGMREKTTGTWLVACFIHGYGYWISRWRIKTSSLMSKTTTNKAQKCKEVPPPKFWLGGFLSWAWWLDVAFGVIRVGLTCPGGWVYLAPEEADPGRT